MTASDVAFGSALSVRPYTRRDAAAVFRFRAQHYGRFAPYSTTEYMEWMALGGPHAGDKPRIWVCAQQQQIVGHLVTIPVVLWAGGKPRAAAWHVDWQLDAACKGRGLGRALVEAAAAHAGIGMALSIRADGQRAFARAGWHHLGHVPFYCRILDAQQFFQARLKRKFSAVAAGSLANIPLRGLGMVRRLLAMGRGSVQLEPIARFDERADQLWERLRSEFPVIAQRDCATLNWRYADFLEAGRYQLFYVRHRQATVGYIVLRDSQRHGMDAGDIVDYLCPPSLTAPVLDAACRYFEHRGAAAVYCLNSNPRAAGVFGRCGFWRRSIDSEFMVRVDGLPAALQTAMLTPRHWFVTAGDANFDRIRTGMGT